MEEARFETSLGSLVDITQLYDEMAQAPDTPPPSRLTVY